MSSNSGEDHWFWDGKGMPDNKHDRRRVFHKSVALRHASDGRTRHFKVGDTVNMAGEGEVWVAQIIELFQVTAHDPELRHILRADSVRNESKRHYELKRCTLRWFYNYSDMIPDTLKDSRWPKRLDDEIWFSDHIEKTGYNSVQVIDGRAWLFDNLREKSEFLVNLPEEYDKERDIVRIVRGFVDSKHDHLPVRLLLDGELKWLKENPSDDPKLFHNSKRRLESIAQSSPSRKRQKNRHSSTLRSPVNVNEDEFDPADRKSKSARRKTRSLERDRDNVGDDVSKIRRPIRRRKITIDDDDESASKQEDDDESDNIPLDQLTPITHNFTPQPNLSDQPENIDLVNDEVRDLVESLNASVYENDAHEPQTRSPEKLVTEAPQYVGEDEITPAPSTRVTKRKSLASRSKANTAIASRIKQTTPKPSSPSTNDHGIIVIDSDDDGQPQKPVSKATSPKLQRFHPGAASRAYRGGRHGKPSARSRSSFMPTSRERQAVSSKRQSNAGGDELQKSPSVVETDKVTEGKRSSKQIDAKAEDRGRLKEGKSLNVKEGLNSNSVLKTTTLSDGDDGSPVIVSNNNMEVGQKKPDAGDVIDLQRKDGKRGSLQAARKKSKDTASPSNRAQIAGILTDTRMEDVARLSIEGKFGKVQEMSGAKQAGSSNVIEVNDSDAEPDDRGLQEEELSVLKPTQAQRKLTEDIYRIQSCMNDVDKNFISDKLEWLLDEIVHFHDGRKGSLDAAEYVRVLRDQLVQRRLQEIGSIREIPDFKSDPQLKARERL